ncbi:MAG TPA: hydroxymethylbilane synthase [Alphaproteobacteria bacterium]|nr:hydroxymethylbilane synthase [Alphaproteobacteria bacterium]
MHYRLGTRGSKLALWQANFICQKLQEKGISCEIVPIKTQGDIIQDKPLYDCGGKGLFIKDIQKALLDNHIDFAVHCLKDTETTNPKSLTFCCFLEREDPRDVLISKSSLTLENLPCKAVIGTSSPRRQALIKGLRGDLEVMSCRGNVDSRLLKLSQNEFDAIILAAAGLKRLNRSDEITQVLDPHTFIPAAGQGILVLECRKDDLKLQTSLAFLNHLDTALCATAERAVIKTLGGSCKTPAGAWCFIEDGALTLKAFYETPQGKQIFFNKTVPLAYDPKLLGTEVGKELLAMSPPNL